MKKLNCLFGEVETCNMCRQENSQSKVFGQLMNKSQGFNPKSNRGITMTVMICANCQREQANLENIRTFNLFT